MNGFRIAAHVRGFVLPRQRYIVGWVHRDDIEDFYICAFDDGQASFDAAIRHADGCAEINPEYVFFVFDDDDENATGIKYRTDKGLRK